MPDFIGFSVEEAVLTEEELNEQDVLFIKFHMRDIIEEFFDDNDDTGQGNNNADEDDEPYDITQGPPFMVESLSISRKDISNKTELLQNISDVLIRLNVPSRFVKEYAQQVYSKAAGSDSGETIKPILVNVTLITYILSTNELTRGVGNLSLSPTIPASKACIEELERVDGSKTEECDCAICLVELSSESSKIVRMPCSHLFHEECLVVWMKKSHLCPVCRLEMPVDPNWFKICPSCRQRQIDGNTPPSSS